MSNSGSRTRFLWVWAIVLVVVVYIVLLLRYHYRYPKSISILQCTAGTFTSELLIERLPVVCSDFDATSMFDMLSRPDWSPDHSAELFRKMRHIAPRFGHPKPIQMHTPQPAPEPDANQATPAEGTQMLSAAKVERSLCDVRMLVQVKGVSRVWLVSPQELQNMSKTVQTTTKAPYHPPPLANDVDYVEIVLRPGNAVFVPFLWGVQVVQHEKQTLPADEGGKGYGNAGGGGADTTVTDQATAAADVSAAAAAAGCVIADVCWDNWVLAKLHVHRLLVG